MTADELKKLTTNALEELGAALDPGHSDNLTALLKTMGRFHRDVLSRDSDRENWSGFHCDRCCRLHEPSGRATPTSRLASSKPNRDTRRHRGRQARGSYVPL
jgi:hypothetical protein